MSRPTHRPVGRPASRHRRWSGDAYFEQRAYTGLSREQAEEIAFRLAEQLAPVIGIRAVREHALDNPYATEDARLVLINMATCRAR